MNTESDRPTANSTAWQAYRSLVSDLARGGEVDDDYFQQTLTAAGKTEANLHRDIDALSTGRTRRAESISITVTFI